MMVRQMVIQMKMVRLSYLETQKSLVKLMDFQMKMEILMVIQMKMVKSKNLVI